MKYSYLFQYTILAIVVMISIVCIFKIQKEGLDVDEKRTVDYPIYQDKSIPLESNPTRTPEETPQEGDTSPNDEHIPPQDDDQSSDGKSPTLPVDGQIKDVDPIGWYDEESFL